MYDHICVARSNQVVIDFGCGDGSFLQSLRIRGYEGRLIGVESSEEGRKATREQLENLSGLMMVETPGGISIFGRLPASSGS